MNRRGLFGALASLLTLGFVRPAKAEKVRDCPGMTVDHRRRSATLLVPDGWNVRIEFTSLDSLTVSGNGSVELPQPMPSHRLYSLGAGPMPRETNYQRYEPGTVVEVTK